MFAAFRSLLRKFSPNVANGEARLSARGIGWLFAFEFVVVLLGVLAAQWLQSVVQQHEINAQTDEALTLYRADTADAVTGAMMQSAALPCVRERAERILKASAVGESVPRELLSPLVTTQPYFEPVSDQSRLEFRKRLGSERHYLFSLIETHTARNSANASELRAQIETFRLLDSSFGDPSVDDLSTVRQAANRSLALIREMEEHSASIFQWAKKLEIEPSYWAGSGTSMRPARDCAELWNVGSMVVPIDE